LIVLLGDVDQAEAHFDPFGDCFNLDARKMQGLRRMYHGLGNRFGHTRWYSNLTYVKWKLVSIRLDIVLVSAQDMCTVCAECTTAQKSVWAHPMVLLGDVGQVKVHFGPFGDSVNLDAR
jgi:hypothetical protein